MQLNEIIGQKDSVPSDAEPLHVWIYCADPFTVGKLERIQIYCRKWAVTETGDLRIEKPNGKFRYFCRGQWRDIEEFDQAPIYGDALLNGSKR